MVVPLATDGSGNDDYRRASGRRGIPPHGTNSFASLPPEQTRERIDRLLRDASRGTFSALPPSSLPADRRQDIRIGVAGLDCKGCAFGAYRALAKVDGVEQATVDFKQGIATARIDPSKTNREAL